MKNSIYLTIACVILLFTSCFKEEAVTPNTPAQTPQTNWYDAYVDGGTLPNNTYSNPLVGTKWVITKFLSGGFAMQYPNDTVSFITNTTYTLNSGSPRTYYLSGITGSTNKSLTLNFLSTFGGSNYVGVVGAYFIADGFINNAEFTDMQNSTMKIKAWLVKL